MAINFHDNIELTAKIVLAATAIVAIILKVKDSYSGVKDKQEIKLDLEIYELLKRTSSIENEELKKSIDRKISKSLQDKEGKIVNFIVGLCVFIGFGFWSIDILQRQESFNAWVILTAFCSLTGLTMLFGTNDKAENKTVFYQIGFYDKTDFQIGFIMAGLTGILTAILISKLEGFSFWQFLSGLIFIISVFSLIKKIKRIK